MNIAKMKQIDLLMERRKQQSMRSNRKLPLKKSPRILLPISIENEYLNDLKKIIGHLHILIRSIFLPALPNLELQANRNLPKTDSWSDDINNLLRHVTTTMNTTYPYSPSQIARSIGTKTAAWNSAQWQKVIETVFGVNTGMYEPWLQDKLSAFVHENVALIKSIQDKTITDIETSTLRSLRQGIRHEQIAKEIEDKFDVSKSRAEFIARDQVSKLNGDLTKTRQQDLGINDYIWHTSDDERVRGKPDGLYPKAKDSHWALEGMKCSWNDPSIVEIDGLWTTRSSIEATDKHPGEDYQCRCWAEPVFEEEE